MLGRNEEVASLLENIGKLLALMGESHYRIRAYEQAAEAVRTMNADIEVLHRAGRLREIPGVGESIATKIAEYLDTGRSSYFEELKRQAPVSAADLLEVAGIGPARAQLLYERLGITTVEELAQAAREQRLRILPGFSAALEERIARDAAVVAARPRRILLGMALPCAEEAVHLLRNHPAVEEIEPVGSVRRLRSTVGDIEILVASDQPEAVFAAVSALPVVRRVLDREPARVAILTKDDVRMYIRVVTPEEYGAALQYYTGSVEHNIALRTLAGERGWQLSEYGLFDENGRRIGGRTEEEIYRALGLDWIPPELRESRGEIEAARQHRLPHLLEWGDLRGDLHVHTDWSDGRDSAARVVEAAIARGYEYIAFTDHSQSLTVARGLSVDRVHEQRRLIDRLNERYAPFRVLHGTEVEIRPSGDLDYPDAVLAEFDIVTASVHGAFKQPRERMAERIIRALRSPYVDILNHPTGRLLQRRPEYEADLEGILQAAVEHGVAVEINGQPERLDLDDVWARRFREMGGLLVCTSDAHSTRELGYIRYAVATARRAWAEPINVLNTLPLPHLLEHLGHRPRRARAA